MEQVEIADLINIIDRATTKIPITIDLWTVKEIAAYLKRKETYIRQHVVTLPSFPQAIRLPKGKSGQGNALWKAIEVIRWVDKYQEKKPIAKAV